MNARRWALAALVFLACSRAHDDAGIVLNVDADVTADRTAIQRLVVTVDQQRQEWNLDRPLPGSLGIETSAGKKLVTVEGFAGAGLRGRWVGTIDASEGSVIVQDVHLAYVSPGALDGGPALDGSALEVGMIDSGRPGASEAGIDTDRAEARGAGGTSGSGGTPLDSGAGGIVIPDAALTGPDGRSGGEVALDGPAAPSLPDADLPGSDGAGPAPEPLSGSFAVTSQFDVSAAAAVPGPIHDALDRVHVFVGNPGAAILAYADQAGVPAASALRAALPSVLMDRLTDWMNTYIESAGSNGITPYSRLVWLDDTVRALLLYWTLESQLGLPIGSAGTHTPQTLVFADPSGAPLAYPIDPALLLPATGVTSVVSWPAGALAPATVTIADHAFALPFGRYALPALDAILLAQYGTPDVAGYLSASVGCAGLATSVASQCVSIVCVGHTADLTDLCEGGLAEGARQIEAQILAIDFKAIRLQQGTATAIGAEAGQAQNTTALQDGIWTVTADFGNGPEPANATFTAIAQPLAGP